MTDPSIIDDIYEAAFVPDQWPNLLERLTVTSGSAGTTLFVTDLTNVGRWTSTASIRQAMEDWIAEGWQSRTQRTSRMLARAHPGFVRDLDVFTPEEWHAEPSLVGFLKPRGFGWGSGTFIPMPTGDTAVVSVERLIEQGSMTDPQLAYLDGLRPHLARSALMAARLRLEAAASMTHVFQTLGLPAVVVGPRGSVIAMNELMQAHPGIVARAFGRLGYAPASAAGGQDGLALLADASPRARTVPLPAGDGVAAQLAHEVPIQKSAHDLFGSGLKVIVLTPVSAAGIPDAFLLAGLFNLTPAEARVAQKLAAGTGITAAAQQLGLSRETVRSHVRAVLAKTHARGQAELAALLRSITGLPLAQAGER